MVDVSPVTFLAASSLKHKNKILTMGLDEDWADETVRCYSVDELADFLAGNPDPTSEILLYCADCNLPKVIASLIRAVQICNDDLAVEIVETSLRALSSRVANDESRHQKMVLALVDVFRRVDVQTRDGI